MSEEESNKPDEKKRPKLKLRGQSEESGEEPEKVTPEEGKISDPEADTTKLELEDVKPDEVDPRLKATMRIDPEEVEVPIASPELFQGDTQPMEPHPDTIKDDTTKVTSEDEEEVAKGKTGPIKSDTTKLSLSETTEGKDTGKINLDSLEDEGSPGETIGIEDLGITSDIKSDTTRLDLDDALKERETKSPIAGSSGAEGLLEIEDVDADHLKSTTMPLGGVGDEAASGEGGASDEEFFKSATVPLGEAPTGEIKIPDQEDEEFFKSATVPLGEDPTAKTPESIQDDIRVEGDDIKSSTMPLEGVADHSATMPLEGASDHSATMPLGGVGDHAATDESPDGIQEDIKIDGDYFKSATMPIDTGEGTDEGIQDKEKPDEEEFFKSATIPIDAGDEPKSDDDLFKSATVAIKDLPEGAGDAEKDQTMNLDAGDLAPGAAAAAAAGERPQTIKIKKPGGKQLDTVRLQKGPEAEDVELQTAVTEAEPPGQKKTVKLKRRGDQAEAPKTMAISRPAPGEAEDAEEAVVGGPTMPGTFFSILTLLSFFLTCGGLYLLYTAYNTIAQ